MVIKILNCCDQHIVHHRLFLVQGLLQPYCGCAQISCETDHTKSLLWPVNCSGLFKVMHHLNLGENHLRLSCCHARVMITIVRRSWPSGMPQQLQPLFIVCKDDIDVISKTHKGAFQSPRGVDSSLRSACRRLQLAMELLQCFVYDSLRSVVCCDAAVLRHGVRQHCPKHLDTFQLASTHIHVTQLTRQVAQSMTGEELWTELARELVRLQPNYQHIKWFGCLSFTEYQPKATPPPAAAEVMMAKSKEGSRTGTTAAASPAPGRQVMMSYEDIVRRTRGHCSLGCGHLALYGSGNMHTWADSLANVVPAFTNVRRVDTNQWMDDSALRGYYWANYSTALGSMLHEIGHTLDLVHHPSGIMQRGGDDFYRFVLFPQPTDAKALAHCSADSWVVLDNAQQSNACANRSLKYSFVETSQLCQCVSEVAMLPCGQVDALGDAKWPGACPAILRYHKWTMTTTATAASSAEAAASAAPDNGENTQCGSIIACSAQPDCGYLVECARACLRVLEVRNQASGYAMAYAMFFSPQTIHTFLLTMHSLQQSFTFTTRHSPKQWPPAVQLFMLDDNGDSLLASILTEHLQSDTTDNHNNAIQ